MKSIIKKYLTVFLSCVILVFLDQMTKNLVSKNLKNGKVLTFFNDIFEILYSENNGAAFGILKGQQVFFYVITIIVIIGILTYIYFIPFCKKYFKLYFCIILILSGAIGNFLDRIINQYVVDFIYFKPINFPVFNFADICITVGAFLLLFFVSFYYKNDDLNFKIWK